MIMDEPTSSMDNRTEMFIKRQLRNFNKGETLILITHKTGMLDLVDRLIVMEQGQIIADGPRDKVLQALRSGKSQKSAPTVAKKSPTLEAKTSDAAPSASEPKPSEDQAQAATSTVSRPTSATATKQTTTTNKKKSTIQTRPI